MGGTSADEHEDSEDKPNQVQNLCSADAAVEGVKQAPPPVTLAEEQKASGNAFFKAGNFEAALQCYGKAIDILESAGGICNQLCANLASNQALCLLKLEKFEQAEARASAALAIDSAHSKAIYRRGLARLRGGDPRGALEDLQKASRLEPQDKDVRQYCEEARQLVEATPVDAVEQAVASGAIGAIGDLAGHGCLYEEKPDLNEGRLAETYKEQREWIHTIKQWTEITEISFAEDEGKSTISVYMTLPGVHDIPKNKVCVWMQPTSLEVRVIALRGSNWCYLAQELWGQIDPDTSSWKVRRDKLSLKLHKRASARSWDKWEKLRRI